MSKLRTIQQQWVDSLFVSSEQESTGARPRPFKGLLEEMRVQIRSVDPLSAWMIYKKSLFDHYARTLALVFPGVWALLGVECAQGMAYRFCQQKKHLPSSAFLQEWGADYPSFLQEQPELASLPYLKEYARYEWMKHQALELSPQDQPLFYYSQVPVLLIESFLDQQPEADQQLILKRQDTHLQIQREGYTIRVSVLEPKEPGVNKIS